jgi:2-methylisocitrate lyase-like PEP mutase family enzyme
MARPELRQALERGEAVLAPAVWDAITARLMRYLGFKTLYVPGSGTGVVMGESEPLLTYSQMAQVAETVSEAVFDELPVIVDIQHGFGEPVHVQLTVRAMEDAGVSAVHIEDQVFPQRVHYFAGVEHVIPIDQYQQKIEYAVKARKSRDFLIIARNDAYKSVEGGTREEAVKRAHAALEVGADAIFVTGGTGIDDLVYFRKQVKDVPMVALPFGGRPDSKAISEYKSMGYQILLFIQSLHVGLGALNQTLKALKETGSVPAVPQEQVDRMRAVTNKLLRFEELWAIEDATTEKGSKRASH